MDMEMDRCPWLELLARIVTQAMWFEEACDFASRT